MTSLNQPAYGSPGGLASHWHADPSSSSGHLCYHSFDIALLEADTASQQIPH